VPVTVEPVKAEPVTVVLAEDGVLLREGLSGLLERFGFIVVASVGDGPSLVEAVTYRHGGHSRADPGKYRPEPEVQAWKAYDPVTLYRNRLLRLGVQKAELDVIDKEVTDAVDLATEEAIAGELPPPASAFTEVWADGGSSWRN